MLLDDKLLWAITILRDPSITQLLRKYLGEKLRNLMTAIQKPTLPPVKAFSHSSGMHSYFYPFISHNTRLVILALYIYGCYLFGCVKAPPPPLPLPLLPFEDKHCRHVLQLCQLAFMEDTTTIHPVSQKILRELVPQVTISVYSYRKHTSAASYMHIAGNSCFFF